MTHVASLNPVILKDAFKDEGQFSGPPPPMSLTQPEDMEL